MIVVIEKGRKHLSVVSLEEALGHLVSDLTATEKISSHACLLLGTHWADACSQPSL